MKKVIIITGQTATGKTNLAIKKALEENGELINVDSRQIYKKLDILTNKDLTDHEFHLLKKQGPFDVGYYELRIANSELPVKIWLYDIVDPKHFFSAYDFEQLALPLMKAIIANGKTPVLVGGTYFYLQYLLYHESGKKDEPNWQLRKELEAKSVTELQDIVKQLKPDVFSAMNESDRQNPRRLMRRIEMINANRMEQKTISTDTILLSKKLGSDVEIEYRGLHYTDKNSLHTIIEKKIHDRIKRGGIDEVRKLMSEGYTENDPGLKTNGYPEFMSFLRGELSQEKAIELWATSEHQYAKRQFTFMKKDPHIQWTAV